MSETYSFERFKNTVAYSRLYRQLRFGDVFTILPPDENGRGCDGIYFVNISADNLPRCPLTFTPSGGDINNILPGSTFDLSPQAGLFTRGVCGSNAISDKTWVFVVGRFVCTHKKHTAPEECKVVEMFPRKRKFSMKQ
ncbi:MAG TPA: hypothetical protein VF817_03970 [Patescibacteria group bacterium]